MWNTVLTTLRINLREKSSLFWLFSFPILLSTIILGMFGNLSATYEVTVRTRRALSDRRAAGAAAGGCACGAWQLAHADAH